MNDTASPTIANEKIVVPTVRVPNPKVSVDLATVLGLFFAVFLIVAAILYGDSNASFFNLPSVLIVVLGTIAATSVSFTGEELAKSGGIFIRSLTKRFFKLSAFASMLIDLSFVAKKKGILALVNSEKELRKHPFLSRAIQMVVDGYQPAEIDLLLSQEIAVLVERHKRSANIARRASEVAPAMGLIGTLVGLVQMLADLENPETIGPAMAVALLTTFYGAVLGTVIMGPLAVKLEKNSVDEALVMNLIRTTAVAVARQDNPRRLEMSLNADLPPSERIRYFD